MGGVWGQMRHPCAPCAAGRLVAGSGFVTSGMLTWGHAHILSSWASWGQLPAPWVDAHPFCWRN
eukprot:11474-Pyramimonas_sp.AAC.1